VRLVLSCVGELPLTPLPSVPVLVHVAVSRALIHARAALIRIGRLNARQSIRAQLQQPSFVLPSRSSGPDGVTTGAGTGASRTMQGGIVFANSRPEASFERPASLELMDDMPKAEGVA
jgi:hypothetical protein